MNGELHFRWKYMFWMICVYFGLLYIYKKKTVQWNSPSEKYFQWVIQAADEYFPWIWVYYMYYRVPNINHVSCIIPYRLLFYTLTSYEYGKRYSAYHYFMTKPLTMANGSYFRFDDDDDDEIRLLWNHPYWRCFHSILDRSSCLEESQI